MTREEIINLFDSNKGLFEEIYDDLGPFQTFEETMILINDIPNVEAYPFKGGKDYPFGEWTIKYTGEQIPKKYNMTISSMSHDGIFYLLIDNPEYPEYDVLGFKLNNTKMFQFICGYYKIDLFSAETLLDINKKIITIEQIKSMIPDYVLRALGVKEIHIGKCVRTQSQIKEFIILFDSVNRHRTAYNLPKDEPEKLEIVGIDEILCALSFSETEITLERKGDKIDDKAQYDISLPEQKDLILKSIDEFFETEVGDEERRKLSDE